MADRVKAGRKPEQWQHLSRNLAMGLQGKIVELKPFIEAGGWTPVDQAAYAIGVTWLDLYHIGHTSRFDHALRFEWRSHGPGLDEIRANPALAPVDPPPSGHPERTNRSGGP